MNVMYRSREPAGVADATVRSSPHPRHTRDADFYDDSYQADVEDLRRRNQRKLQRRFESIFAKYGKDFAGASDEIDLVTGDVTVNNGHLRAMRHERDVGPNPLRLSLGDMRMPSDRISDFDEEELVPLRSHRQQCGSQTNGRHDERPGSSAFDEYYSNISNDLAVEVVDSALPERGQAVRIDQEFFDNFNRNIMQQITLAMQFFMTSRTSVHDTPMPQIRQERLVHSSPAQSARQWDSTRDSSSPPIIETPRSTSQRQSQSTPTRWEQSLWADDERYITRAATSGSASNDGQIISRRYWTEEEDRSIMHLKTTELLSFPDIAGKMPDRSVRAIENRYFRLLSQAPTAMKQRPKDNWRLSHSSKSNKTPIAVSNESEQDSELLRTSPKNLNQEASSTATSGYRGDAENSTLKIQSQPPIQSPSQSKASSMIKDILKRHSTTLSHSKAHSPAQGPDKGRAHALNRGQSSSPTTADSDLREEDELIIRLKEEQGLTWAQLAAYIPKKKANALSLRYSLHLRPGAPKPLYRRPSPELQGAGPEKSIDRSVDGAVSKGSSSHAPKEPTTRTRKRKRREYEKDDELIVHWRKEKSASWSQIEASLPRRTAAAWRTRYYRHLRPGAPDPFPPRSSSDLRVSASGQVAGFCQDEPVYIEDSEDYGDNDLSATDSEDRVNDAADPLAIEITRDHQPLKLTTEHARLDNEHDTVTGLLMDQPGNVLSQESRQEVTVQAPNPVDTSIPIDPVLLAYEESPPEPQSTESHRSKHGWTINVDQSSEFNETAVSKAKKVNSSPADKKTNPAPLRSASKAAHPESKSRHSIGQIPASERVAKMGKQKRLSGSSATKNKATGEIVDLATTINASERRRVQSHRKRETPLKTSSKNTSETRITPAAVQSSAKSAKRPPKDNSTSPKAATKKKKISNAPIVDDNLGSDDELGF